MHLKNLPNQYQQHYPAFEKTPKAVIAAIAYSFALQLCEDDSLAAQKLILEEWKILNLNNIVPQKAIALETGGLK